MSDDATPNATPPAAPAPKPAIRIWDDFRLALLRFAQGDFQRIKATDTERAALAASTPPVTDPLAQDYAAWRRSILFVASLCLIVSSIFAIVGFQTLEGYAVDEAVAKYPNVTKADASKAIRQNFGASNLDTLSIIPWVLLLVSLLTTGLTIWATAFWSSVRSSRRLARRAWYVLIGVPVLMALVPWTSFLDFSHLGTQAQEQAMQGVSTLMGLIVTVMLAPKVISIFPGVMRSALNLKTLVPESGLPAWLAAVCAPLFALVVVLGTAVFNQSAGNLLLFFAVVFVVAAQMSYLRFTRSLMRPLDGPTAGERIRRARIVGNILNGIGMLLGFIFLIQMEAISWDGAIQMFVTIFGALMLMMVVSSDFLLAVMRVSYAQSAAIHGTEMADSLATKIQSLSSGGLMDLRTRTPKDTTTD